MDTEQCRQIVAAHAAKDRSLANLRNAAAMSVEDAGATELLERAGDTYAQAVADLRGIDQQATQTLPDEVVAAGVRRVDPAQPEPPESAAGTEEPPSA